MDIEIRPEIIEFAENMEMVMRIHDKEKGDTWKDTDWDNKESFLKKKFIEELAEVLSLHYKPKRTDGRKKYRRELIDLSNICMMLHYHNR